MNSRRDFIKKAFTLAAAFAVTGKAFAEGKKKKAAQDPNTCLAKPTDPGALKINYVEDKSKVSADAKKAADVGKPLAFAKQNCGNCILFQGGVCTIITEGCKQVKPEGWCPTWNHNPAVKS